VIRDLDLLNFRTRWHCPHSFGRNGRNGS